MYFYFRNSSVSLFLLDVHNFVPLKQQHYNVNHTPAFRCPGSCRQSRSPTTHRRATARRRPHSHINCGSSLYSQCRSVSCQVFHPSPACRIIIVIVIVIFIVVIAIADVPLCTINTNSSMVIVVRAVCFLHPRTVFSLCYHNQIN